MFHQFWRVFNHYFFEYFFCSSLSLSDAPITCILVCLLVCHIWGAAWFLLFFSSVLWLAEDFLICYLQVCWIFFPPSIPVWCWIPLVKFFSFIILVNSRISICFYFVIPLLLVSVYLSMVSSNSLNIFVMAVLKNFVKSIIWALHRQFPLPGCFSVSFHVS